MQQRSLHGRGIRQFSSSRGLRNNPTRPSTALSQAVDVTNAQNIAVSNIKGSSYSSTTASTPDMLQAASTGISRRPAGPSQLRRFFDKVMKDGAATFDARKDGPKFLRAATSEFADDPVDLLYRLNKPQEHGQRRVKACLSCCDDFSFIKDHLLPFLGLLGCDALARGTCKQPLIELLDAMYQVPGLLPCLHQALVADRAIAQLGDVAPLAWFILNIALHVPGARADPMLQQFIEPLQSQGGAAGNAAQQLRVLLASAAGSRPQAESDADTLSRNNGASNSSASEPTAMQVDGAATNQVVAMEDLLCAAGGRHDNDHSDFRDIRIMVTSQEALCIKQPHLPREGVETPLQLSACPEAALLDRQFRLLREDMVGPLRAELQTLGISQPAPSAGLATAASASVSGTADSPLTHVAAAAANSRNVFQQPAILGVCLKPRPCVMFSVKLPSSHRAARLKTTAERIEFWQEYGHGTLPIDALVCLASPQQPLVFATVVRRDPKELAEELPMIGLAVKPGQDVEKVLSRMGQGPLPNTVLVQVSTSFLSTRPVLQCLQQMSAVPLAEEIVHGKQTQSISYLDTDKLHEDLASLAPSLDSSQNIALSSALQNRVALIQGPPGTGKTFIGVNLCELILKHSTEKILCVCYTNHALDQFLEALLSRGITSVVRIGSRSKSKQLEQYNLRELASRNRAQSLNSAESRRMGVVYSGIESIEQRLQQLADMLTTTAGPISIREGRVYSAAAGASSSNAISSVAAAAIKSNQAWQQRNKQLQEEQEKASQARQAAAAAKRQGKKPRLSDANEQEQQKRVSFDEWDDAVGPLLEDEQSEVWEQLTVPAAMIMIPRSYLWTYWLHGFRNKGAVDRFLQARADKEAATAAGGWEQAKKNRGKRSPLPDATPSAGVTAAAEALASGKPPDLDNSDVTDVLFENIWSLPAILRQYLAQYWRAHLRTHWSEEVDELMQQAYKMQQELKALHDSGYEAVLNSARVIGCTCYTPRSVCPTRCVPTVRWGVQ